MMKTYFSFLFLLSLFCTNAQEIFDKKGLKKCRKEFSKKICLSDDDKDNTLFYLDLCPKDAGSLENNGCPWPDTDLDGVLDKDDACPTVAGPPENTGCPWPDTDRDGILDKDDPCPTVPGYPSDDPYKNGCPKEIPPYRYSKGELDQVKIKFLEKTKDFDYNKLADLILSQINEKDFASNIITLEIASFSQMGGCGFDKTDYSPRNLEVNLASEKFWNERNFGKFVNKFPSKIIFPYSENEEINKRLQSFKKAHAKNENGMTFYNAKNNFKKLDVKEINFNKNFNVYIFFNEEDDSIFVKINENTNSERRFIQIQAKGNTFIQTN